MAYKAPSMNAPDATNMTRQWIEHQLTAHNLADALAHSVHRKYPSEEIDQIWSWVGERLAYWCWNDTLAPYLAEGPLSHGRIKEWLVRRFASKMLSMGCEPVERARGLRSEVEIIASREAGRDLHTMSAAAVEHGGVEVAHTYDDNDQWLGYEVIDLGDTPEDEIARRQDAEEALAEGRRLVAAAFREAGDRYQRIFDHLFVTKLDRAEIAEIEGCSVQRVSQLSTRVRNTIRDGGITRTDAQRVLSYLSGQRDDSAVWAEIKGTLRLDKPRMNRAVAYLAQTGVEIEHDKDVAGRYCYTLTR